MACFLCKLSLNLFRKHVIVLDKQNLTAIFLCFYELGCEGLLSLFFQIIVSIDSIDSKPFTSPVFTLCW